ncbi:hypothetical protein PIB30_028563 [Stylosanthes scabra]|uniref:Uncharacterized protein n=1 Tax=Stylosanthes scabra TaxID=79078 RepID=A0ABU6TAR6_9FABA|nr:hypothetical protein [Stylosanthes scabra]
MVCHVNCHVWRRKARQQHKSSLGERRAARVESGSPQVRDRSGEASGSVTDPCWIRSIRRSNRVGQTRRLLYRFKRLERERNLAAATMDERVLFIRPRRAHHGTLEGPLLPRSQSRK